MSPRRVRCRLPIAAAVAGMVLAACAPWQSPAPVTPASYQSARDRIERTVGKLRRLAVLQVVQEANSNCGEGLSERAALAPVTEAVRSLLAESKGYELADAGLPAGATEPADPATAPLVKELLQLGAGPADAACGPLTCALLARLRQEQRVDGLLVLHTRYTCPNALPGFRPLIAIFSLGLSEALPEAQLRDLVPLHAAFVFDTGSGHVLWRHGVGLTAQILAPQEAARLHGGFLGVEAVLEGIEPAVPKILVR